MKTGNTIAVLICTLLVHLHKALAQTWVTTLEPGYDCNLIGCSADGTKLLLTSGNETSSEPLEESAIYVSTNSGLTWAQISAPAEQAWTRIVSSADGMKWVAVSGTAVTFPVTTNGFVYVSTNLGASWTQTSAPCTNWLSVASSADGNVLVAGAGIGHGLGKPGPICYSTNAGATWTQSSAPNANWTSIASSADGTKLVAAGDSGAIFSPDGVGNIYISTNSGATWTKTTAPSNNWSSVASSYDGRRLAVAAAEDFQNHLTYGEIYFSTNSGDAWTQANLPNLPYNNWVGIATSADGSRLFAVAVQGAPVCISTDSGTTWALETNAPDINYGSIALSADGNKVATVGAGGGGPIALAYYAPSPSLNVTATNGNLAFSWIVPSTNLVLQQNLDLTANNWTTLTNLPALNLTSLQEQLTLSPTSSMGFFRLVSQ